MIAVNRGNETDKKNAREEIRHFINEGLEDLYAGRVCDFDDVVREFNVRYKQSND